MADAILWVIDWVTVEVPSRRLQHYYLAHQPPKLGFPKDSF